MRVLVLAAHADDEILGPGGALIRHVDAGDEVHAAICVGKSNASMYRASRYGSAILKKRKAQAEKVAKMLGFRKVWWRGLKDEMLDQDLNSTITSLEGVVAEVRPEIVYMHHGGDGNQDHRGVFHAGIVALRGFLRPGPRRVLCFETPSTTEQAPPRPEWQFMPNYYVDVSRTLERKLKALEVYADEMRAFPHPRSYEAIRALARTRGATVGFEAAEAFALFRERVETGLAAR
jgi:N-acetylglucosamine malate deacetylase 1